MSMEERVNHLKGDGDMQISILYIRILIGTVLKAANVSHGV